MPASNEMIPSEVPLENLIADDPELRSRIGQYLGGLRQKQKKSQEEAAKSIGISRPHLSNIENGRARAAWLGLQRMAEFYTQDIKDLIEKCGGSTTAFGSLEKRTAVHAETARNGALKEPPAVPGLTRIERFLVNGFRMLSFEERQEVMRLIQLRLGLDNGQQT